MTKPHTRRLPAHDLPWGGVEVDVVVSPVNPPTPEQVKARLLEVVRRDPNNPIGARMGRGRWHFVDAAELDAHIGSMIVDRRRDPTIAVTEVAERLLSDFEDVLPLRVMLGSSWSAVSRSHLLGDGVIGLMLNAVVLGADGAVDKLVEYTTRKQKRFPLARALLAYYGRHQVLRTLRSDRPSPPPGPEYAEPLQPFVMRAVLSDEAEADLLRFCEVAQVTEAVAIFSAIRKAIASVELLPDASGAVVLMDARGYLPDGTDVSGNFVEGVYLDAPTVLDAQRLKQALRFARKDGRVLASLTLTCARAWVVDRLRLRPSVPAGPPHPTLSLSHIAHLARIADIDWAGEPIAIALASTPHGIGSMSWNCGRLRGRMHLTAVCLLPASERARVQQALDLVAKRSASAVLSEAV
jgi:hypothetical protein